MEASDEVADDVEDDDENDEDEEELGLDELNGLDEDDLDGLDDDVEENKMPSQSNMRNKKIHK